MVESPPRPRVTVSPDSGTVSPALLPSVMTSLVGEPRRLRAGFGLDWRWRLDAPAWLAACGVSTRAPKRSDRITDTADRTKIHSSARNPNLIRVSVNSDKR